MEGRSPLNTTSPTASSVKVSATSGWRIQFSRSLLFWTLALKNGLASSRAGLPGVGVGEGVEAHAAADAGRAGGGAAARAAQAAQGELQAGDRDVRARAAFAVVALVGRRDRDQPMFSKILPRQRAADPEGRGRTALLVGAVGRTADCRRSPRAASPVCEVITPLAAALVQIVAQRRAVGRIGQEGEQAGVVGRDVEARLLVQAHRRIGRGAAARRAAGGQDRGRELGGRLGRRDALGGDRVPRPQDLAVEVAVVADLEVQLAEDLSSDPRRSPGCRTG